MRRPDTLPTDRSTLLMPGLSILCRVLGVVCGLVAWGMG